MVLTTVLSVRLVLTHVEAMNVRAQENKQEGFVNMVNNVSFLFYAVLKLVHFILFYNFRYE